MALRRLISAVTPLRSPLQAKVERIASLETENAILHIKLAQVRKLLNSWTIDTPGTPPRVRNGVTGVYVIEDCESVQPWLIA